MSDPKVTKLSELETDAKSQHGYEQAFRRGFTHGISACIDAMRKKNAGTENLCVWLHLLMDEWRYGDLSKRGGSPDYPITF